jgi:murein DD-endopeptidase MepM/ murein hydrolase activator NlpD
MHLLVSLLVPATAATLIAASALSITPAAVPATVSVTLPATATGTMPVAIIRSDPLTTPASSIGTRTTNGSLTGTSGVASPRGTGLTPPLPGNVVWPLSPRPVVHRRFEQPLHQWSRGHRGVDLVAAVGQPVLSASEGVVAFSGVIAGRGVVTVRHRGGLRTSYEPVEQRLGTGTPVHPGTRIAVVSATPGHCAPLSCLHWGAITGETYRDPLALLGFGGPGFGRPILLPLG